LPFGAAWARHTVLDEAADYKVKRINVVAGGRLSYQRHARREEHWLIVHGAGRVTLDGEQFDVLPGAAVDVAVGAAHRIANTGTENLTFIEVQRGDYFGEDDIVRLDDDYGRTDRTP
jgi:mannose-6-phosphate isomerase-like protein (cupin superfamily)